MAVCQPDILFERWDVKYILYVRAICKYYMYVLYVHAIRIYYMYILYVHAIRTCAHMLFQFICM